MTRPRPLSNLIPALVVAGAMLTATTLVTLVPRTSWAAVAASILLASGLIAADRMLGLRGGRPRPSVGAAIMAVSILVACGIVASDDLGRLAAMMPIFGSCAVLPVILQPSRKEGLR